MSVYEDLALELLGRDRLNKVVLHRGVNDDGAPILRVFVVFDGDKPAPTADEMLAITDRLWDRVLRQGSPDIVVPSFISSDDYAARRSA